MVFAFGFGESGRRMDWDMDMLTWTRGLELRIGVDSYDASKFLGWLVSHLVSVYVDPREGFPLHARSDTALHARGNGRRTKHGPSGEGEKQQE